MFFLSLSKFGCGFHCPLLMRKVLILISVAVKPRRSCSNQWPWFTFNLKFDVSATINQNSAQVYMRACCIEHRVDFPGIYSSPERGRRKGWGRRRCCLPWSAAPGLSSPLKHGFHNKTTEMIKTIATFLWHCWTMQPRSSCRGMEIWRTIFNHIGAYTQPWPAIWQP